MTKVIENKRINIKRSVNIGQVPSLAPTNDHTDGTWGETDLYEGEFFLNLPDKKLYVRANNEIVEVTGGATETTLFRYKYSTATGEEDPALGYFRLNHIAAASSTAMFISKDDMYSIDNTEIFKLIKVGTIFKLIEEGRSARYLTFKVTDIVDNGSWFKILYILLGSDEEFTSNNECNFNINFNFVEIDFIQTWFVGKHGLDTNKGTTQSEAFLTFQKAIDIAVTGELIRGLDGGTYDGFTLAEDIDIEAPQSIIDSTILVQDCNTSLKFKKVTAGFTNLAVTQNIKIKVTLEEFAPSTDTPMQFLGTDPYFIYANLQIKKGTNTAGTYIFNFNTYCKVNGFVGDIDRGLFHSSGSEEVYINLLGNNWIPASTQLTNIIDGTWEVDLITNKTTGIISKGVNLTTNKQGKYVSEVLVVLSEIEIDFNNRTEAWVTKVDGGGVVVDENITIVWANDTNAKISNLFIEVTTANREITFDSEVVSNDSRWNNTSDILTLIPGSYLLRINYTDGYKALEVLPEIYSGGGMTSLIEDLTPELGGDLDNNYKRELQSQGDDIVSANNLTLDSTLNGNVYVITGTTTVNLIEVLDWIDGSEVVLQFSGITIITHGATLSGDFAPIYLAKGDDYTTVAGDTIAFRLINGEWFEVSNTKVSSGGGITSLVEDITPQLGGVLDTNSKSIKESRGAAVASATNIVPLNDGNSFSVTGVTTINAIVSDIWSAGNVIRLQFAGILTITHNGTVAGDNKAIFLKKAAAYTTVDDDVLVLEFNGTIWNEINDLTKEAGSSGGGHTYKENDGVAVTARTNRNIITNGTKVVLVDDAGNDETEETWEFEVQADVDPTGVNAGDLWGKDSSNAKTVPQPTQFDERIYVAIPEANIGYLFTDATHVLISTLWLYGRTCTGWLINDTANTITGLVITNGTNNLHTPVTLASGESAFVTLDMQYASPVNDIDLYAYSTTWNSGTVTFRQTQIQN